MFKLKQLPYETTAFQNLSSESFEYHHGKHHATYVDNLNKLLLETPELLGESLEEIIKISYKKREEIMFKKIFNNAAQHWNHAFFWNSITPYPQPIDKILLKKIQDSFETMESFYSKFEEIGLSIFGSGWIWVLYDKVTSKIEIVESANAETLIQTETTKCPLLVCDLWEHAYYIDYRNNRKNFLKTVFGYFNWSFAEKNYELT